MKTARVYLNNEPYIFYEGERYVTRDFWTHPTLEKRRVDMKDKKAAKTKTKKESEVPIGAQVTALLDRALIDDDLMRTTKKNAIHAVAHFLRAFEAEIQPVLARFKGRLDDLGGHPDSVIGDESTIGLGPCPIRIVFKNHFYEGYQVSGKADGEWSPISPEVAAQMLVVWNSAMTPGVILNEFLTALTNISTAAERRRKGFQDFEVEAREFATRLTKGRA
jgi:hypothetical protein